LPWPPVPTDVAAFAPTFEQQFRTMVPWWPVSCPILIPQPTSVPPFPTIQPPAEVPVAPPRLRTPPAAPAPAPAPAPVLPPAPASLAQALQNPIVVILLGLAIIRTVAAVAKR
jgi:hypothetical protein